MATAPDDGEGSAAPGDIEVAVPSTGECCAVRGDVVEYASLTALALPFYLPAVLMWTTRNLVLTVIPMYVLARGFSYHDLGLLMTIGGVGTVAGNVPAGRAISAHGPRFVLIVTAGLLALSALLALLTTGHLLNEAQAWTALACSVLIGGTAESAAVLARQTFLGAAVPLALRGRAGSTLGGTQRVGATLGPFAGGLLAHALGAGAAFLVQAVMSGAVGMMLFLCMPLLKAQQDLGRTKAGEPPEEQSSEKVPSAAPSMLSVALAHRRVLCRVTILTGSLLYVRKARELLFTLEGHSRGFTQAEVGHLAAISYAVDAVCFPVAGQLLDKVGRTWTAAFCLIMTAVSLLLLRGPGNAGVLLFAVVGGFANGCSSGCVDTIGADIAPPECRSEFLALYRTISRVSELIAPALLGVFAEVAMSVAELVVVGVALGGAMWGKCCVEETLKRPPKADEQNAARAPKLPETQKLGKYQELDESACEPKLPEPQKLGKHQELDVARAPKLLGTKKLRKYQELDGDEDAASDERCTTSGVEDREAQAAGAGDDDSFAARSPFA